MTTLTLLMKLYYDRVAPALGAWRKSSRLKACGYDDSSSVPLTTLNLQGCSLRHADRCNRSMQNFLYNARSYQMQKVGQPEALRRNQFTPLVLDLQRHATYDAYESAVRTLGERTVSKARGTSAKGFVVRRFAVPMHVHDIYDIQTSTSTRSGGPVLAYWLLKLDDLPEQATEPVAWKKAACPCHWNVWWGVFEPSPGHRQGTLVTNERLVAYALIIRNGDVVQYRHFMGHRDYLGQGVMAQLHFEMIRWLMESNEPMAQGVKTIWYGAAEHGATGLLTWKQRMAFTASRCWLEFSPSVAMTDRSATRRAASRSSPAGIALMKRIVALSKRRGFVFPSSEIYSGLNGVWDYGPLGTELKRNLKDYWWKSMTQMRDDIVGFDGSILMNRNVWKASGHEATFSDPMVDCKKCQARFRGDQLDSSVCGLKPSHSPRTCGGELTAPRTFNLMFQTSIDPEQGDAATLYLRPETAQAMFVQFKNVLETSGKHLPFGIAQIGKAFRNEINPRNFTFRSREFEQMEVEFFIKPGTGKSWLERWRRDRLNWYGTIGIPRDKIKVLNVAEKDRAFYSLGTYDLEYAFPFGVQELEGIAHRGNYDLKQHQEHSGQSLEYFDPRLKESYLPEVVEPSAGVDRTILALLCEGYSEVEVTRPNGKVTRRSVLRLVPRLAPIKAAILPLLTNRPHLVQMAREIHAWLRPLLRVHYDASGSIGKRYRRMDEVGTPFAITVDYETFEGAKVASVSATGAPIAVGDVDTVTIRERDTMEQQRIAIADLAGYLLVKTA